MEDYNERLNYGDDEHPIWRDRLWVSNNGYGYGNNLFDRKTKKTLIIGQTKEFCELAKGLLKNQDIDGFKKHLESQTEFTTNQILIYKEKHFNAYYNVFTLSQLYRVALEIISMRLEDGYIDKWTTPPTKPDFEKEDIEKLPESLKKQAKETYDSYLSSMKAFKTNNEEYELATKAVKEKDGYSAWLILCRRSSDGYEYEQFEIVKPEDL